MKKQAALLLSTLVLMGAVSVPSANAFCLFHKKAVKPVVEAPAKAPEAVAPKAVVPVAKTVATVPAKPAVAKTTVKPCAKAVVKPCAKKAPVKK